MTSQNRLFSFAGISWLHPRRLLIIAALGLFLLVTLFGAGLALFTAHVLLAEPSKPRRADAIVVLTGGSGRLDHAINLLNEGYGKKLLISGVHPNFTSRTLEMKRTLTSEQISCCIELDSEALNTVANATQTAQWAEKNSFNRLIVVTSAYHMPRTLLEMRRAAPEIDFQAYYVAQANGRSLLQRVFDTNNMHLLTKEYGKLLAAFLHGSSERLNSTRR